MKFVIYKDAAKEYRWRLVSRNGRIIANSGEGYKRKITMRKSILTVCEAAGAKIIDQSLERIPKNFSL